MIGRKIYKYIPSTNIVKEYIIKSQDKATSFYNCEYIDVNGEKQTSNISPPYINYATANSPEQAKLDWFKNYKESYDIEIKKFNDIITTNRKKIEEKKRALEEVKNKIDYYNLVKNNPELLV